MAISLTSVKTPPYAANQHLSVTFQPSPQSFSKGKYRVFNYVKTPELSSIQRASRPGKGLVANTSPTRYWTTSLVLQPLTAPPTSSQTSPLGILDSLARDGFHAKEIAASTPDGALAILDT